MRIRRSCSNRFFISLASCRAYSAAWLVYLSATILFPARVAAETVTLPDPLSTNLYTTVEAWVDLETVPTLVLTEEQKSDWLNRLYNITTYTREDAVAFYYEIYNLTQDIHDYIYDFEQNADFPADISDEFIEQWETLVDDINLRLDFYQQDAYAFITGVTNEIEVVDRIVTEIIDLPYTNVIKSVSLGQQYGYTQGGACHCPDYTVYLQGLRSDLQALRQSFDDYIFSIARSAISAFGSASGLGSAIGEKYLFLKGLLDGILGNLSFVDENAEDFGQRLAELGYTLSLVQQGDEENLRYYNVASNLYAHLIDGWCFPTNIAERPLWVTFDQDALRSLLDDVLDNARIKVSVTNALKVSVTNELQVAVTNDIHVVTDVSQEITQIENNMTEIEDLAGNLHVDEVAEITDTIDDRTHLFDGWDARIRQFPERFESLWNTQYTLPESIIIYDGYSATVRSGSLDGWHGSSGSGSRRSRASGEEEILTVPTLELYIGPDVDTASGRWIYRVATACHNVTNVVWSLLFLAILVRLFKIDIFLLRSSCFIFLAWLSALGVGGMRRLSIMEAMAESFDRIAKLFTSMFGDGGEDAA